MNPLWQLILVSIVPGLLWLWFFSRQDIYEPEPKKLLLLLFVLGMAVVLPVFLLELPWRPLLLRGLQNMDRPLLALLSFGVVGVIEETAKFLVLLLVIYRRPEFDEPVDGIIYGVTVGLGFAALENLFYASTRGIQVGLFRAVVTSLAHASFTGWLGSFLARARFGRKRAAIVEGLAIAIALHGIYDFLLLGGFGFSGLISFVMVGGALLLLLRRIRALTAISPFRP